MSAVRFRVILVTQNSALIEKREFFESKLGVVLEFRRGVEAVELSNKSELIFWVGDVEEDEWFPPLEKLIRSKQKAFEVDSVSEIKGSDAVLEQLKDSQIKLKKATEIAKLGYWELHLEGSRQGELYWSDEVYEIWGRSREEFEVNFESFYKTIHSEDQATFEREQKASLAGKQRHDFVHRILLPDGRIRWVHEMGGLVYGSSGIPVMFCGTVQDITDKQEVELELLRFKKVLENVRDGVGILGVDGKVLFMNAEFVEKLGYSPDDLDRLGGPSIVYANAEQSETVFGRLMRGKHWQGDVLLRSAEGKLIDFYLSAGPIFDNKGNLVAVFGIHTDISIRVKTERKLERALREKNAILESIGDGFFAVDSDWIVTYWNQNAEHYLGCPRERILGKCLWDNFDNYTDSVSYQSYSLAMSTREVVQFEDYFTEKDSWFEISVYPSIEGLSVFFKDITERKRHEREVQLANDRFEMVSRATRDAIWDWNIQLNTLYWGEGFRELFGHEVEKITPTLAEWTRHVHPDDIHRVEEELNTVVRDPEGVHFKSEYRYRHTDGGYREVVDKGVVIRNENKEAIRMIGAMADITEQKRYERSLKRLNLELSQQAKELALSNAELEQFAYVASHDLQEPLRMVSGFLTQLERKYRNQLDDKAKEYIYYAVDGAKRMRTIILDLLEFSRIGREKQELEWMSSEQIVEEVIRLHHRTIKTKKANIQIERMPRVYGYRSPLIQIFSNLVGNALKYTQKDRSPEIIISGTETETHWQFSVKDNGIGISSEYHQKIFQIFQRLHHREAYSGNGMGLAIVKKIVENQNGFVWVISKEGEGSEFIFTIEKP